MGVGAALRACHAASYAFWSATLDLDVKGLETSTAAVVSLNVSRSRLLTRDTSTTPSHAERLGAAQVTMTDWAFLMYMLQDGVNWWIWVLHFFGVFAGGMLLM